MKADIELLPAGSVCCIDEVQRVPELLPIVHALIEEKRGVQFVLIGSSARKLRRSSSDLLGGRALMRYMPPFFASELGTKFSLTKALRFGLIPLIWESASPGEQLAAYLALCLKQEVQEEGMVRNLSNFARFMEVASFSQGSLLNATRIANEAYLKRQTVDNYLQILEDLLLAFTVPVFTRRAKRSLVAHRKFYYFDVGVFRQLRPRGILDVEAELEGPAMEGLVAQHLQAWVNTNRQPHELFFWQTRTGLEVDFIVYGPQGFWAIEVKRAEVLSPHDIRALAAFKNDYPEASCALIYGGKTRTSYRGFLCIPLEEFLKSVVPEAVLF